MASLKVAKTRYKFHSVQYILRETHLHRLNRSRNWRVFTFDKGAEMVCFCWFSVKESLFSLKSLLDQHIPHPTGALPGRSNDAAQNIGALHIWRWCRGFRNLAGLRFEWDEGVFHRSSNHPQFVQNSKYFRQVVLHDGLDMCPSICF